MRFETETCLQQFEAHIAADRPIIGAGAGTGISAKFAERGGADLIIVYNSGRYRMAGRSSMAGLMPYGDANEIVVEMASEVLPVVEETPVLAGVCGTDPFREMDVFLKELKRIGFAGVQNFPTVGGFTGSFRQQLENGGLGYDKEVALVEQANELDMLTCPYVYTEAQARQMAGAGADIVVAHMGLTAKGSIGAKEAMTLEDAAEKVQRLSDVATEVNPDVLTICHGGPIAEPDDAQFVLEHTDGVVGFFGASSIERLPTERAIERQTREFKSIEL